MNNTSEIFSTHSLKSKGHMVSQKQVLQISHACGTASTTNFFSFCRSGEITVPTEKGYNVNYHRTSEQTIPFVRIQSL